MPPDLSQSRYLPEADDPASPDAAIRLRFEGVFANLCSRFVNLRSDQVDQEIENAQRYVCQSLGLDLSGLWQWSSDSTGVLVLTHVYTPPDGPKRPSRLEASESFPWTFAKLSSGKSGPFILTSGKLPPEAVRDEESQQLFGVKSTLVIPLTVGGAPLIGVLTFNMLWTEGEWPEPLIRRLEIVAQIFGSALARRDAERALHRSQERFDLATKAAGAGVWELNCQTGVFWASPQARKIFGFTPDEPISLERFEAAVVPEDLPNVREALAAAVESGTPIAIDFRLVPGKDPVRWVNSLGRPHANTDDGPQTITGVTIDITDRKNAEMELRQSITEIQRLKRQIEAERDYLAAEIANADAQGEVIGKSKAIRQTLNLVAKVATTHSTVLVTGETGTGKEMIACEIHRLSPRRNNLMVRVNCAALPTALVESELFGREKGAFTGALTRQAGRFELADKGTIFLDEVGELSLEMQAKLLRVLQSGEFERLGSTRTTSVDVRVIAATNRDLAEEVRKGRFREDLFYRLNVFPIEVPPLRERVEDIPLLVWAFLGEFSSRMGKKVTQVSRRTMERLQQGSWPGNVRELRNVIERAVILSTNGILSFPESLNPGEDRVPATLAEVERRHILATLERTGWRIKGPNGAATALGLPPSTLYSHMRQLGIPKKREQEPQ